MKKSFLVVMFLLMTVMVFAGRSEYRFVEDNMDSNIVTLQIVSEDDYSGEGIIFINIGVGPANKGSASIAFTSTVFSVYGSDAVPVYYNFDGNGNGVSTGKCVNSNMAIVLMNNIRDIVNGILTYNTLNVRIIGYDGTQYNYSFDLNSIRNAMREAGMKI